ncbi:C4-dicarboxylate ABC transporter [Sulfitobacter sp. EhC04]|uniref:TRAP transporter small permease subunit n=1 Tax=Sulfitobacter sp. EhC04 TaxID=1849168 RepID=UPI0007F45423|nr:TRAP transporter small permease subunit [Sulfitobacter sp. EhC04]OAN77913.1 C4-dicarboxylate ABC transporter [Sulfitobacter sp. EhC04]
MRGVMRGYIRVADAVNYRLGRVAMYGIFALMGVLLWSSISKTFFVPTLWTLEMAQFIMVGYYILGGPYSLQLGSNVRMDLLYGNWSIRRKAWFDLFTVMLLIFYLCVLLYGALSSTAYSLGYWQDAPISYLFGVLTGSEEIGRLEQSSSAWRPYMWPIKVVMILGFFLMILQCLSELCKDVLRLKGEMI